MLVGFCPFRSQGLCQIELPVTGRVAFQCSEDLVPELFVKGPSLIFERVERDMRAAARPGQLLGGVHELRAPSAAAGGVVHPERRYVQPLPPGVSQETSNDGTRFVVQYYPDRLLVGGAKTDFIEFTKAAKDDRPILGARVEVDEHLNNHTARLIVEPVQAPGAN